MRAGDRLGAEVGVLEVLGDERLHAGAQVGRPAGARDLVAAQRLAHHGADEVAQLGRQALGRGGGELGGAATTSASVLPTIPPRRSPPRARAVAAREVSGEMPSRSRGQVNTSIRHGPWNLQANGLPVS